MCGAALTGDDRFPRNKDEKIFEKIDWVLSGVGHFVGPSR
jgi:hypothetical protein